MINSTHDDDDDLGLRADRLLRSCGYHNHDNAMSQSQNPTAYLAPVRQATNGGGLDCMVSVELPNPELSEQSRRLHKIVLRCMVDSECGQAKPRLHGERPVQQELPPAQSAGHRAEGRSPVPDL